MTEANLTTTVIVIEDDPVYGRVLCYQLSKNGLTPSLVSSEKNLFDQIEKKGIPDLIILDYDLGITEPTGLEVCRKIRSYTTTPVLMLTGNNEIETVVSCLNAGAEQYINKPCDIRELMARIDVVLRRRKIDSKNSNFSFQLTLDENTYLCGKSDSLINANGEKIKLTSKEMGLLELFLREPTRFIDRKKAFHALFGYDMTPMNRSIDVLISRLRKKLKLVNSKFAIKNLRGSGYLLYQSNETEA